jgi:hypothetical protein
MKKFFKILYVFCCINIAMVFAAETPEDMASRLSNDLRARLPGVQIGTTTEQQVHDFFNQDVIPTGILGNTNVVTDDSNLLRTANDSIGGGNFSASVANTLLSMAGADFNLITATVQNPCSDTYDAYGIMMYQRGLWRQEWCSTLSENARAILGL